MKLSFFIFVILACANCSNQRGRTLSSPSEVQFDTSLLIPWDEAKKDQSTAEREAIYKFNKNGKVLYYLAAGHTNDKKSKTFTAIKWVFDNTQPDIAIIEGVPNSKGISHPSIYKSMTEGIKGDFYPYGERAYILVNAHAKNVGWIGGEPDQIDIFSRILKKGFSSDDYMGFLFVRQIPQEVKAGRLKSLNAEKEYNGYVAYQKKQLSLPSAMSFDEFKAWYKKNQKKEFVVEDIQTSEAAPEEKGEFLTQRISATDTAARDEFIVSVIQGLLNAKNTVFIAYGSSHYRIQHKVLKSYFGNSEKIKFQVEN